jgi:hypothetical protein
MTKLLEKAFAEAAKLPAEAQDALAAAILDEVATEPLWDDSFRQRPDALSKLADEALGELRGGQTQPLDPERL